MRSLKHQYVRALFPLTTCATLVAAIKPGVEIDSGEITLRVAVIDNEFIPPVVYIFAGDSILWEHDPGQASHTVTSGRSSGSTDNPGCLFDEESSDKQPLFQFAFEIAGDYPYFCRPHEHLEMSGIVHVWDTFVRGDASLDDRVDISDSLAILNHLFLGAAARSCRDALDANDDGRIDIADPIYILEFLFVGTRTMPEPFPLRGADRTDDNLPCWPEMRVDRTQEAGC